MLLFIKTYFHFLILKAAINSKCLFLPSRTVFSYTQLINCDWFVVASSLLHKRNETHRKTKLQNNLVPRVFLAPFPDMNKTDPQNEVASHLWFSMGFTLPLWRRAPIMKKKQNKKLNSAAERRQFLISSITWLIYSLKWSSIMRFPLKSSLRYF